MFCQTDGELCCFIHDKPKLAAGNVLLGSSIPIRSVDVVDCVARDDMGACERVDIAPYT